MRMVPQLAGSSGCDAMCTIRCGTVLYGLPLITTELNDKILLYEQRAQHGKCRAPDVVTNVRNGPCVDRRPRKGKKV